MKLALIWSLLSGGFVLLLVFFLAFSQAGFIPSWIEDTCSFILSFLEKLLPQSPHSKGLFPECIFRCCRSSLAWGNPLLHRSHWKLLTPVCLPSWTTKWFLRLKLLSQWEHLYGRSPVWLLRCTSSELLDRHFFPQKSQSKIFPVPCITWKPQMSRVFHPGHKWRNAAAAELAASSYLSMIFQTSWRVAMCATIWTDIEFTSSTWNGQTVHSFLMAAQVLLVLEALGTMGADKRPVARVVWGFVILERIRPSKFLTADITLEGPFIGVQLCVIP